MDYPSHNTSGNYLNNIRQFLAEGGDLNQLDKFHDTFLHIAAKMNEIEVVVELATLGAKVNYVNILGKTPLHYAVIYRNCRVVDALIDFGALVDIKDCCGNTALHYAINICASMDQDWKCNNPVCKHRPPDMNIIQKLLDHKDIDVNVRNSLGFTPLLWAFKDKNPDIIKSLLKKSALVNVGNNRLETPLHAALSHSIPDLGIVRELLHFGASFTCRDSNRFSPLDLVLYRKKDANSQVLKEELLKLLALYDRNNELDNKEIKMTTKLSELSMKCREEIHKMRKDTIDENSLYDIVLQYMEDKALVPPEVAESAFEVLKTGNYDVYYAFILKFL